MTARRMLIASALASLFPLGVAGAGAAEPAAQAARPHIAVVNGRKVTVEEFERAFGVMMRQKFYHRTPPEGQLEQVRLEVAEGLVDRALLLAEAEKRGIAVDEGPIKQVLDGYEKQYGAAPDWKATRERALPQIRRQLSEQQLLAKLDAAVREVPAPDEAAVRAFYDANSALFTEPERVHLSVILLKVDPAAPKALRDKAREEGRDLRARLARGAEFAELARIHSGDGSAGKGGDLGYLHRGMLGEGVHREVDLLKAGEVSPSFDVLDGVAVFKLHERAAARLHEFDAVKARAAELLKRERSEQAWKVFVANLRQGAVIEKHAPLYPAVPARPGAGDKEAAWLPTDKPRGP